MAGLPLPSIQTVTAKVRLSQSSVLENIFLEDTRVSPGPVPVSDMINFILSQATQAQAVSAIAVREEFQKRFKTNEYLQYGLGI